MNVVPPYAGQGQSFIAVPQSREGSCSVVPPYVIVTPAPTPEDGCSSMPPESGQTQTDFIDAPDGVSPEAGCSVRPPASGQHQDIIHAPYSARAPETSCTIVSQYTGQSQTSELDAWTDPAAESGCFGVAPFSGQSQSASIEVPLLISYKEVLEESCWSMPPYATIFPQPAEEPEPAKYNLDKRQTIFGATVYEAFKNIHVASSEDQ